MGVSAVPQSHNVFPNLTVDENLDIGTYAAPPPDKAKTRARVLELFPDLTDKLNQPRANSLAVNAKWWRLDVR